MSTTLYEGARVNLTRFCGPADEGPDRRRYQLGLNLPRAGIGAGTVVPYAYAILTREELRQVAEAIHGAEAAEPLTEPNGDEPRPIVVCLCGSTRFMDVFHEFGWRETMAGRIVLSVGVSKHLPPDHGGEALGADVAAALDQLHLRKIDLADEVLILNVDGYIGESTRRELAYAREHGKRVRFLEGGAE